MFQFFLGPSVHEPVENIRLIEKYIDKAQATKLSLVHTSEIHQCPALTICAHDISNKYDKDHLNRCGLR